MIWIKAAQYAMLLAQAGINEYNLRQIKLNLTEGEIEIKRGRVSWNEGGIDGFMEDNAGYLNLTNKRLVYLSLNKDFSYPLSAIVSVKFVDIWNMIPRGIELEFSDERKIILRIWNATPREDWVAKILEAKNSLGGANAIERAQDGTVLDEDKTKLRRNMTDCFNESELRTVCFDLHIDYESVPGSTKEEKARELIVYCEHHGLLIRLLKMCQQQRPHVKWI